MSKKQVFAARIAVIAAVCMAYYMLFAAASAVVAEPLATVQPINESEAASAQAEAAFPSVTRCGLPVLRRAIEAGASENDAGIAALLAIMLVCSDSNVIHRSGFDYWKNIYPSAVAETQKRFDPLHPDYAPLYELERSFMPLRVSPGGAADLLSCTYFLYMSEKI